MRVLRTAERMGYRPNLAARSLRTGSTNTVLMVVPVLSNPFFAAVHSAAVREAAMSGVSIVVYPLDADDEMTPFPSSRQIADGILACSVDPARISELVDGLPFVVIDGAPPPNVCAINADITGGASRAVTHLAQLGHRRVVHLAADRTTWTFRQRGSAFDAACAAHGLTSLRATSRPSIEDGYRTALALMQGYVESLGIVCDNDQLALGVYWAAHEAGLGIPRDISVIGFDDTPISAVMRPPLTTIHVPGDELGTLGIRALIQEVRGDHAAATLLPTSLVIRGSTSAPPMAAPGIRPIAPPESGGA
ncbi:LacI family DNA-binding transcriptional regulator [Nocardia ninae]|uniref:LacI family transcriptional regulator n=3 Tax=Nocardia ninae TaxID=356145 RepID=A0A511MN26_9NOCA|nr:LacI family transcriptional regulator [Nocardia ninae NBRC 108245]